MSVPVNQSKGNERHRAKDRAKFKLRTTQKLCINVFAKKTRNFAQKPLFPKTKVTIYQTDIMNWTRFVREQFLRFCAKVCPEHTLRPSRGNSSTDSFGLLAHFFCGWIFLLLRGRKKNFWVKELSRRTGGSVAKPDVRSSPVRFPLAYVTPPGKFHNLTHL